MSNNEPRPSALSPICINGPIQGAHWHFLSFAEVANSCVLSARMAYSMSSVIFLMGSFEAIGTFSHLCEWAHSRLLALSLTYTSGLIHMYWQFFHEQ
jgi:hypothetical protein